MRTEQAETARCGNRISTSGKIHFAMTTTGFFFKWSHTYTSLEKLMFLFLKKVKDRKTRRMLNTGKKNERLFVMNKRSFFSPVFPNQLINEAIFTHQITTGHIFYLFLYCMLSYHVGLFAHKWHTRGTLSKLQGLQGSLHMATYSAPTDLVSGCWAAISK